MRLVFILIIFSAVPILAQYEYYKPGPPKKFTKESSFYGGLEIDLYSNTSKIQLISGEVYLKNKFAMSSSLGISNWGVNGKIQGSYYSSYPIGVSYNAALNGYLGNVINPDTLTVEDDLVFWKEPTATFDISATNYWRMGSTGRIGLTIGYAIPFKQKPYTIEASNRILTDDEIETLNYIVPGGFFLKIGINWGIGGPIHGKD